MTDLRPTPWRTNGPEPGQDPRGSFAHRTVRDRIPKILEETVAAFAALPVGVPDDRLRACAALGAELTSGRLRALEEPAPDRAAWDAACAPHVGHSWLDLPWYFAESFFYRRVLEATGYFAPGPLHGVDPFLPAKHREEAGVVARVAAAHPQAADLPRLLRLALWGNRADLSYTAGRAHGEHGTDDDLLIDDTSAVVESLARRPQRIGILLDNAGTELSFDLVLAEGLRARGHEVVLWAKPQPFFVSDATPVDVARTAALLGRDAGEVRTHAFFASSGFLLQDEMPADLVAALGAFDLVIAKGDCNARRLVGDAPWPHDTPLTRALSFPCPVLLLRTMKAEVLVGAPREVCARAAGRDPAWMTSGRFGLIAWSRG